MWGVSGPLTLAEEHVPDAQHGGPGQRAREGAHEPLRHVEDGLDLVLLQVSVGHGRHALQQGELDLPVQLDGLLETGKQGNRQAGFNLMWLCDATD